MKKVKYLIFCYLIVVSLAVNRIGDTNAFLVDREESKGNVLGAGDWTRPTSEITSTDDLVNSTAFTINYEAEDNALDHVELWYSFNWGEWQHFGDDVPNSPGHFDFTSPEGDGIYRFLTVAVDQSGNVEDKNDDGEDDNASGDDLSQAFAASSAYQVEVDTEAPYTTLSLGEFGDDTEGENRFAVNEKLVNGNFEDSLDPERGWVGGGDGDHRAVNDTDLAGEAEVKAGDHSFLVGWQSDPAGNGVDFVYQTASVSSPSSTLSFWYRVISDDTVDYDWFEAKLIDLADVNHHETILRTGSDEVDGWSLDSDWQEVSHSLADWLGKTIKIWFGVTNHDEPGFPAKTFALLDDVRLTDSDNNLTPNKTLTVNGSDPGSGVAATYYRVNDGDWQEVGGGGEEFSLADEGVGDDAGATVDYYSVDLAGNTEATQSLSLKTDEDKEYFGVVINEFMADPVGDDDLPAPEGEWVDLYNNGETDVDVAGWVLYDGDDSHPLPITTLNTESGETIVPSGDKLRVYLNGAYSHGWLNNSGDEVRLYDALISAGGRLIDSFTYPAATTGKSWRRVPDGTGTWADPEEMKIELTYHQGKVKLTLTGLAPETEAEYELTYLSQGLEKGILGKISPGEIKEGKITKDLVLGSCSQGVCVFDQLDENKISFSLKINQPQSQEVEKEFSW